MINYQRIEVSEVPIVFPAEYRATAMAMAKAVEKTISVVSNHWNLSIPRGCEVHVLTDLEKFIDQTVPKRYRFLVKLTRPLWRSRAQRAFVIAGGWMLPWRGRCSVGVKPPELLARSATGIGKQLFEAVSDPFEKVQHLTCHEVTHACTAHLRLPPWLNEGLAMRAVDHMAGHSTVREETRSMVRFDPSALKSRSYRRIKASDHDRLLILYSTGYWITRQLDEEHPSVIGELLKCRRPNKEITRIVDTALKRSHEGDGDSI